VKSHLFSSHDERHEVLVCSVGLVACFEIVFLIPMCSFFVDSCQMIRSVSWNMWLAVTTHCNTYVTLSAQ